MPPFRALWEQLGLFLVFLSHAVFLTKCLPSASYSLMKIRMWCLRFTPTWQWSLVHADNSPEETFELFNIIFCNVFLFLYFLFALPMHFIREKKKKKEMSKTELERGLTWRASWMEMSRWEEAGEGGRHKTNSPLKLTEKQDLATGTKYFCWNTNEKWNFIKDSSRCF